MRVLIFTVVFLCCRISFAQDAANRFFFASKYCRDSVAEQLKQQVERTIVKSLSNNTFNEWSGAFWAMELMRYKPVNYVSVIPNQLTQLPNTGPGFQRAFFEMLYMLYPGQFNKEVKSIWSNLKSFKVKAMALEYLALSDDNIVIPANDSFLQSDYYACYKYVHKKTRLPLPKKDMFLDSLFLYGQTVLCSFQSANRNNPGFLMIRTADGKWLRDEKGNAYKFPQLARAVSNLPFYLTNGNTPQGLYRINGFDTSDNAWIGPTTNLQMCLPFENVSVPFFTTDTAYEKYYAQLLGSALKGYSSLWESYAAGKIGRTEIIAHGTTIDPDFYRNELYYPNTPSLGCLCSPEVWNDDGELQQSVQLEWITLVKQLKTMPQFLIVADIADFHLN